MHASRSHSQESPFDSLITACMHIIITKGSSLPQQWTDHSHHLQNNDSVQGSGSRHKLDGTLVAQPHRTEEPEIIHYRRNKVVDSRLSRCQPACRMRIVRLDTYVNPNQDTRFRSSHRFGLPRKAIVVYKWMY